MSQPTHRKRGRPWRRAREAVLATSDICWLCGQPGANSVDHVVPVSLGGHMTDLANLRPAHLSCNVKRGNRRPDNGPNGTSRRW